MSTTTAGATIFYTTDSTVPTHNGATATGTTQVYTGPVTVGKCGAIFFEALAYKSGMADSVVTTYNADYTGYPTCGNGAAMGSIRSEPSSPIGNVTTIIFSVWDGDWAIVEEYTTSNVLVQKYLQGYHGLVKTLVDNIYYYQDELGSTSHIATASGALLESYQYDLYGKPRVYNAGGTYQPGATPVGKDLFTGQRWVSEIGLYDDRNRFMSPELGRFLQPDPIGFKGDASNLYRYCGNDWANRTDPMGLGERESNPFLQEQIRYSEKLRDQDRGAIMSQMLNVQRIDFRDAVKDMAGFTMGGTRQQAKPGSTSGQKDVAPTRSARAMKRDFYGTRGKQFNEVMRKLVGKDAKFEPQTIHNAPDLDVSKTVKQLGNAAGTNDPNFGDHGTIFIAREILTSPNENGFHGTYAHELANVVDYRLNGRETTYGIPNEAGKRWHDPDTGARVETIMFGGLQY